LCRTISSSDKVANLNSAAGRLDADVQGSHLNGYFEALPLYRRTETAAIAEADPLFAGAAHCVGDAYVVDVTGWSRPTFTLVSALAAIARAGAQLHSSEFLHR
jgi:hypothetical protein